MPDRLKEVESALLEDLLALCCQLEDCGTPEARLVSVKTIAQLLLAADELGDTPEGANMRNAILARRDFDRIHPSLRQEPFLEDVVRSLLLQHAFLLQALFAARADDYFLAYAYFQTRKALIEGMLAAVDSVPRSYRDSLTRDRELYAFLKSWLFSDNETPQ